MAHCAGACGLHHVMMGLVGCFRSSFTPPPRLPSVRLPLSMCHVTYVSLSSGARKSDVHWDMAWPGMVWYDSESGKFLTTYKDVRRGGGVVYLILLVYFLLCPCRGEDEAAYHGTVGERLTDGRQEIVWCCQVSVPLSRLIILQARLFQPETKCGALCPDDACCALPST